MRVLPLFFTGLVMLLAACAGSQATPPAPLQTTGVVAREPYAAVYNSEIVILSECVNATQQAYLTTLRRDARYQFVERFGDKGRLGAENWCTNVFSVQPETFDATLTAWQGMGLFVAVAPNYVYTGHGKSSFGYDPSCDQLQTLNAEASTAQEVSEADLTSLYSTGYTGQGVTVAVLDGGVAAGQGVHAASRRFTAHAPDPRPKAIKDSFDCPKTPYQEGHGSIVTAIVQSLAPDASVLALKVCDEVGDCYASSIAKALAYLRNRYPGVPQAVPLVNASFGGRNENDHVVAALIDAMSTSSDTLFIVSAGNDGSSYPHYPAHFQTDYSNVLAVSALKQEAGGVWSQASFNTQDPNLAAGQLFGAPGVRLSGFGNRPEATGTSFAAPVATAVAALALERFPNLSARGLRTALLNACDAQGHLLDAP